MKKLSLACALMVLAGCSSTTEVKPEPQPIVEPVAEVIEEMPVTSLTVVTTPNDARVRIMNIKPVYEDGIELDDGKYDIEVTKPGYLTYRKWIVVDKKTILTVDLDSIESSQATQ
ncbi:PEGA domain-containing protein [Pseudoalteromonas shioyasakiensis]|uniref:hypothetical protein n=1 Tax=Pseudoalteromonas shioyasakiensis TaxID=1190813 RepID=UPI002095AC97|nr:hypothetical protein [Pseudoalteromonas shioyasakiensis]MCO6356108.1 PEGA domain-containing protein [Pseudoalteromonas shioyasakiensis]